MLFKGKIFFRKKFFTELVFAILTLICQYFPSEKFQNLINCKNYFHKFFQTKKKKKLISQFLPIFQIAYKWKFFFVWIICDVLEEFFGKVPTLEYFNRKYIFRKAKSTKRKAYSFKPRHLLNDYCLEMECTRSFKVFASKNTKLAFDTYLDA